MAKHQGPRRGSAAHRVLCKLVDLGGTATFSALKPCLSAGLQRSWDFDCQVVYVLTQFGMARLQGPTAMVATVAGKQFVAESYGDAAPETKYVGQIVPPRSAPEKRPLNLAKHMPVAVVREGAYAHQHIPSLMAGKRIKPGTSN